jgi:hypothetical protein
MLNAQFRYVTNNGAITITGYYGPGGTLSIPGTTNGLPVVAINSLTLGEHWPTATNLVIPQSVTNIGELVIASCALLLAVNIDTLNPTYSSVDGVLFNKIQSELLQYPRGRPGNYIIPNTVVSIRSNAFNGYGVGNLLSGVTIPASVRNIGDSAFQNCMFLTNLTMGPLITNIGSSVFANCVKLGSVVIPEGLVSISSAMFDHCSRLTNVLIAESVKKIGIKAFQYCSDLPSISVPDGVTNIGHSAFLGCGSMTNVTLGSNLLTITSSAFQNCRQISSVLLPSALTTIENSAFAGCSSLTNIIIPASVTNIGPQTAFPYCPMLTAIDVDFLNEFYSTADGVLFDKDQTALLQYPAGKAGTSYTIPATVSRIGYGAFFGCVPLTAIAIPNSVTELGSFAFGSSGLTNLIIPESVTFLGTYLFDWCTSLKSVTIPDSITHIPDGAFFGCTALTSITLPEAVSSMGAAPFYYCSSLRTLYFKGSAPSLGANTFSSDSIVIVYYLPGTTGWTAQFAGRPTAVWLPRADTDPATFGIHANQFGFTINWARGMSVVVEACTNLHNPNWSPIETNTLATDSYAFTDYNWTSYPARFYRVRWP